MAYATFTDALMQAKRQSQLGGTPFATRDAQNLQSAYMSGAAERALAGRQVSLGQQALSSQKQNFANTLTQEKEIANTRLAQDKTIADTTLAQSKSLAEADLTQKKTIADLTLSQTKALSDESLGTQRQLSADRISADRSLADSRIIWEREKQAADIAAAQVIENARGKSAAEQQAAKIEADRIISDNQIKAARDSQTAQLVHEKELAGMTNAQARASTQAQIDAMDAAGDNALTGNILSTAATGAGLYYLTGAGGAAAAGGVAAAGANAGAGATAALTGAAPAAGLSAGTLAGIGAAAYGLAKVGQNNLDYDGNFVENIGRNVSDAVANVVDIPMRAVSDVFCFLAGTPVEMEDGTILPVEQVKLFDRMKDGGLVTGCGQHLADDLYNYEGVYVTGTHAVFDGQWLRVKESPKSVRVNTDSPAVVYILSNEKHRVIVNGITFADFTEIDGSENMLPIDRIAAMNRRDDAKV